MEKPFSGGRMTPIVTASPPLRWPAPTDGLARKGELAHHPVESLVIRGMSVLASSPVEADDGENARRMK